MPYLDSCCRCGSLRTGSIITAVLSMVAALATLIIILVTKIKMRTIVIDSLPDSVVRIIMAINLVMTIIISLLMLIGVLKRNRYFMIPWVVLAIMLAVGLLVSVIYTSVVFYIHKYFLEGSLILVFGLIALVIYVYMWLVVFSFWQMLREEHNRGPYYKAPYPH